MTVLFVPLEWIQNLPAETNVMKSKLTSKRLIKFAYDDFTSESVKSSVTQYMPKEDLSVLTSNS